MSCESNRLESEMQNSTKENYSNKRKAENLSDQTLELSENQSVVPETDESNVSEVIEVQKLEINNNIRSFNANSRDRERTVMQKFFDKLSLLHS
ncbi:hypothetical protein TSAR_005622 [Trichomalopsis sarcophagae]|uniref:Uncharacterized protein n=1 Tax=Trichomalopsis sarcophagae TaxID=543379 RepID=A0A232FB76_9HYME|nr:hypothetical protein TSAR_005622 [Trichomalopsis sarcophagae]